MFSSRGFEKLKYVYICTHIYICICIKVKVIGGEIIHCVS